MSLSSKCLKCENSEFEIVEHIPKNSEAAVMLVQCASCKTVFGVMDFYNLGHMMHRLEKNVKKVERKLDDLHYKVNTLGVQSK